MLKLTSKDNFGLIVKPRFPAKAVFIEPLILEKLKLLQSSLPTDFKIVLTRGYENPKSKLGFFRFIIRQIGKAVFLAIYPKRSVEISEIFLPNGHDLTGKHIDISLIQNNRQLRFLPFGVFTPLSVVRKLENEYLNILEKIEDKISELGGKLHYNKVERLQMHIDF